MKSRFLLITSLITTQMLSGQTASLAPVSDLRGLGITNLKFSAEVEDTEVFVIQIETTGSEGGDYLRKVYIRPQMGETIATMELPILETQKFFAPAENNKVILKMPYGTVVHEVGNLVGALGGQDFVFTVTGREKATGKETSTTYNFNLSVEPISELTDDAKSIPVGSTFITATKKAE